MLALSDTAEVSVERTTDHSLTPYSFSMLDLMSRCPTRGLVTYVGNRVMSKTSRAMPLEAGAAAHQAFAAARLWQLRTHQGLIDHCDHHGGRLFTPERYASMLSAANDAGTDTRNAMLRFCLEAFYTYGFYDDPADKRRTFTNIEEALIAYLDRFDYRRDVWVQDKGDPCAPVGIELPIDMTVSFKFNHGIHWRMRYIGTADGVTVRGDELRLEENKTASRLGEAWTMSFWTSHQVTGYMMGLQTMYGLPVVKAAVHGMAIPLPRSYDAGGLMTEVVSRNETQFADFLAWMLHCQQLIDRFGEQPYDAPKNTASCNDYFRACSFIPLCASTRDDRIEMYAEMDERDQTPTEKAMEGAD